MTLLWIWMFGCGIEKPPLTLDTADTAIVWEEPTDQSARRKRGLKETLERRGVR